MNRSSIKPIITLAILSFILTLAQYGKVNSAVENSQLSVKEAAAKQTINTIQLGASEPSYNAGISAGVGIAVAGILSLIKTKNSSVTRPTAPSFDLNRASYALRNKLLGLLQNDQQLASRLLFQVKMNNPDRSANWCVEKVIYDLQRDRSR